MQARPDELLPVPSAENYRKTLEILAYSMTPKQRLMLVKHYRAPEHTVTASQLAEMVGYPNWRTVNLQYGLFAQKLADRLGWVLPPDAQSSYAVAWFEKSEGDEEHWQWHMHPELAEALVALRWVSPPSTKASQPV